MTRRILKSRSSRRNAAHTRSGVLVFLLCGALAGATSRKFVDYRDYPLAGTPEVIASADLNRDGIPDAIVGTAGGVNIFLGRSGGTFGLPSSVGTLFTTAIAVGDFNGDGKLDIASTFLSSSGSLLALSLGDGGGGFSTPRTLPNRCVDCSLAAADFNQDGKLDLALANTFDLSILLGDGHGNFSLSPVQYPGSLLESVRAADLNADGFPDIVAVDFGAASALVFLGKGDGTFSQSNYPVGSSPFEAAVGDFNADGNPDLAVNDRDANLVYVLLNTGGGVFRASSTFPGGCSPFYPQSCTFKGLTAGDLNGDGKVDLATPGSVLIGDGQGSFAEPQPFTAGNFPEKVAVTAPIGEEKRPLLLVANSGSTNFTVRGVGATRASKQFSFPIGDHPVYVADGDFNGDGKTDLAVAVENDRIVRVLLGDGNGGLTAGVNLAVSAPGALVVRDFNGDHILDIAAGSSRSTSVFLGNGDGTFRSVGAYSVPGDCTSHAFTQVPDFCLASGDINGDGIPDLIGASESSQKVMTLLGNGDGTFRAGPVSTTGGGNPLNLCLADFDHDGKLDLAVVEFGTGVFLFRGNGDGSFTQTLQVLRSETAQFSAAADLNGDGNVDLVVAGGQSASLISYEVFFLPGNGNGTFGTRIPLVADGAPNAVAIADFNNDGKLDIASANNLGYDLAVITGDGSGHFSPQVLYGAGQAPAFVLATDLSGDGKMDIVTANQFSNDLTIALHAAR